MKFYSPLLRRLLNRWPGQETFGIYRFLPVFFVLGAALEFSMINWRVGEVNFYNTFKQRQAQQIVQQKLLEELESTNKKDTL